jgi:hypothetical protein
MIDADVFLRVMALRGGRGGTDEDFGAVLGSHAGWVGEGRTAVSRRTML